MRAYNFIHIWWYTRSNPGSKATYAHHYTSDNGWEKLSCVDEYFPECSRYSKFSNHWQCNHYPVMCWKMIKGDIQIPCYRIIFWATWWYIVLWKAFYILFVLFDRPTRKFFIHIGDVTITGERLQILIYARHSWPLSNDGSLACHTYCDNGHPFIMVMSEENYWRPHLFPSV